MMVCGWATGVQFDRNGSPCWGIHSDGARLRITLGTPVEPLLQIPLAVGETAAGRGLSDAADARASSSQRLFSSTTTAGSITSRTRSRSHAGRSQCMGTGTAPIFQQPSVANTRCSEFGMASATREPVAAPLAASARPHWLARASSSPKVSDWAVPSSATIVTAASSRRCSASSCSLAPNGTPSAKGFAGASAAAGSVALTPIPAR